MRKLIAGMKISVDGKMEGPEGTADWVEAWSEDYGLIPQVDACLLGGGMYPGYEQYWTAVQNEPEKPAWITGSAPTPAEIEWAGFSAQTPHYVLSSTLTSALWPKTSFVGGLEEITALKQQPGKDIYLVGGGGGFGLAAATTGMTASTPSTAKSLPTPVWFRLPTATRSTVPPASASSCNMGPFAETMRSGTHRRGNKTNRLGCVPTPNTHTPGMQAVGALALLRCAKTISAPGESTTLVHSFLPTSARTAVRSSTTKL
jgi:dihydrofolate reductase